MKRETAYPGLNLYEKYRERSFQFQLSPELQDRTTKITMTNMNYAINNCEQWEYFLDIGGGSGHYSAALAALFKKGTIVEIDSYKEHGEIAEKYTNLTIVHTFIEDSHFEQKADFILLGDVFEHIKDIQRFVEQVSDLQREGGVVYILTPNPNVCGPAPESDIYHTKHAHGHIKHYNVHEITKLMSAGGYELLFGRYEETSYRRKAKNIFYGLSRYDAKLKPLLPYRMLRPLLFVSLMPLLAYLERSTYRYESRHSDNPFTTTSLALAFKKTRTP